MNEDIEDGDTEQMTARLDELRLKHRDLDMRIDQLEAAGEQLFQVMALKREKLRIKDRITWLTSRLTPDIIA